MYLVIYYPSSALPNVCLTPMEMNDLVKKISSPKEERQRQTWDQTVTGHGWRQCGQQGLSGESPENAQSLLPRKRSVP